MAIKKKALKTKGTNNVIAFFAFLGAGILIGIFLLFQNDIFAVNSLSLKFWIGIFSAVAVNMIATYFLYKALDLSELSYLMPFMTLTSLTIIIPPMIMFGEYPSMSGIFGIVVVVLGALLMDYKNPNKTEIEILQSQQNRKGLIFFLITAVCYTISPTVTKLAVVESSPLFATFVIHILMGLFFGIFILALKEIRTIKNLFQNFKRSEKRIFSIAILLASLSIAISNVSINYAYEFQSVAYVMAIKRVMPFFAFLIGYFYFKEYANAQRKIFATMLMVIGAIIITAFK